MRLKFWRDGFGGLHLSVPWRTPRVLVHQLLIKQKTWLIEHAAKGGEVPDLAALRKEAVAVLPAQLARLAELHQLTYKKVQLRVLRSRWGSCSTSGTISLNIHLVRLPEQLRDYVLLHELAHLNHPHHQASFWEALDRLCGGVGEAKRLDGELRRLTKSALI